MSVGTFPRVSSASVMTERSGGWRSLHLRSPGRQLRFICLGEQCCGEPGCRCRIRSFDVTWDSPFDRWQVLATEFLFAAAANRDWLLNSKMRVTWPTCQGISYFLTAARFNRLFRAWFQPVRTSWVDCAKAICPAAALFYHYDWWPTISNLSLRSCDGRWSMPGSADGWADGKPGSSIWSWGFSRTHTACGAAGLAGWTSVCDEQAGWTSRLAIQPTGQMNIPYKWTSFRNMLVNISIWLYDHSLRIPKWSLHQRAVFLESHSNIRLSFFDLRPCCCSRRWEQVPLARRHRHKHVRRQTAVQQSFELTVLTSRRLMSRLCSKKIKKNRIVDTFVFQYPAACWETLLVFF